MKWCFLVTYNLFMEFLGKLAHQVIEKGDECFLIFNDKISEFSQKQYFPEGAKSISIVDWCKENYKEEQSNFGDLSWKDFFADFNRFCLYDMGFESATKLISQKYQFFDFFLNREKPDVVIYEPPSGTSSEILYGLCKKYGILYLGLLYAKVSGKVDVRDLKYTCSKYEKTFREIDNIPEQERDTIKKFIEDFLSHSKVPPYVKPERIYRKEIDVFSFYLRKSMKMLPFWLKYLSKRGFLKSFDKESDAHLKMRINYPFHVFFVRFKKIFQGNKYDSPNIKDSFFFFPLQSQPEASTLVNATYFYDLVNTVKNIAFALPFPYKLYVKEHPQVKGDRPWNFYKEIKKIPNVVLISPFENVGNLIEKSLGVITLTSTIGLEAALIGKPTYVLGDVLYEYHPLCQKLKSFAELKKRIEQNLIEKPSSPNLEEVNTRFVSSYFRNLIDGDIGFIFRSKKVDTNDYGKMYEDIKKLFLG